MNQSKKVTWIRINADITADLFRVKEGADKEFRPDRITINMVQGQKIKIKVEFKDKKPKTYEAEEFFANAQIRRRGGPENSSRRKG